MALLPHLPDATLLIALVEKVLVFSVFFCLYKTQTCATGLINTYSTVCMNERKNSDACGKWSWTGTVSLVHNYRHPVNTLTQSLCHPVFVLV